MDEAGDSPSSSHPTTSTPRRSLQKEKKRLSKSSPEELNKMEKEEVVRMYGDTDEKLEQLASAHNMTALNVKSVLRNVIKNHRALARVLGTDVEGNSSDGVRNTRSKTKAGGQDATTSNVDMTTGVRIKDFTFVDVDFNEDDEFDNDWRPDEENVTDSSQLGSDSDDDYEESEKLSGFDEEEEEDEEIDTTLVEPRDVYEMERMESRPQSRMRPASAVSQTLNALVTRDDEPSNDYYEFVNKLQLDEIEYNEEEDPDFIVPIDDVLRDEPDYEANDFWNSTIPQREVEGLFEDIVPPDRIEELARNLSPPMDHPKQTPVVTVMESAPSSFTPHHHHQHHYQEEVVQNEAVTSSPSFNNHHRAQLRAHMEQHLQILTQTFIGCYFEPLLQEQKMMAREMILDFTNLARDSWRLGANSAFHSANLAHANETCEKMDEVRLEKEVQPIKKEDLIIGHPMLPITKAALSLSPAILYPHLISRHRMVQSIGGTNGWNRNELIYFAMTLNRHGIIPTKDKRPRNNRFSVIAVECMPWRTPNDLRWQFNGMKRGLTRNGVTKHNEEFFGVVGGTLVVSHSILARADNGCTMKHWPRAMQSQWFRAQAENAERLKKRQLEKSEDEGRKIKRRKERVIEEGDDEMEKIVIIEDDEEEEQEEGAEEHPDSHGKNGGLNDSEEVIEVVRGGGDSRSEGEKEDEIVRKKGGSDALAAPVDFSHLMAEMSQTVNSSSHLSSSLLKTPTKAMSPVDKTMLPPTPGKRIPSPLDESIPWFEVQRGLLESPPPNTITLPSRIKTPGGTLDYVDSLMGYFGTPEREVRRAIERGEDEDENEAGPSTSGRGYSNLFGDFDFDESMHDEESNATAETVEQQAVEVVDMRGEEGKKGEEKKGELVETGDAVKQKRKRLTMKEREEKAKEALTDEALHHEIMMKLAKKAAEDVKARVNMHHSVFKQIRTVLADWLDKKDKEKMIQNLIPILKSSHKDALCLLAVFIPLTSLPPVLLLSKRRQLFAAAFEIIVKIHAYMKKVCIRRISYRQMLKSIVDAYKANGRNGVHKLLKELLPNDPFLLNPLLEYFHPTTPGTAGRGRSSI